MTTANEDLIRGLYAAYAAGDTDTVVAAFSPELEWTFFDPMEENPLPQTCHGRGDLILALRRQRDNGLRMSLEEVIVNGDQVMVTVHIPGVDQHRVRAASDRNYDVLTIRGGQIVALRACHDRAEALAVAAG